MSILYEDDLVALNEYKIILKKSGSIFTAEKIIPIDTIRTIYFDDQNMSDSDNRNSKAMDISFGSRCIRQIRFLQRVNFAVKGKDDSVIKFKVRDVTEFMGHLRTLVDYTVIVVDSLKNA
ncbi:hypothetical protein AB6A40_006880 [Gnathostoma spinigerum]|uniref:Uncharacterized protein n=1 Tax=Gnathostoma spinigerum TaxID=75299 RepID=A0ABD6ERU0_9BILA